MLIRTNSHSHPKPLYPVPTINMLKKEKTK
jgi:hypothetical protein